MAAPKMPNGGMKNKGRGAYVDRDKPAQIRFSNISAGKGKLQIQHSYCIVGRITDPGPDGCLLQ